MNEQALKERIKYIARTEGRVFNQVWRILILERLLVRLSHSSYSEQFIFKGGLLLSYYITLGRETKDADFTTREQNLNTSQIEKAFQEIAQIDVKDGFSYTFSGIDLLPIKDMDHSCYRVTIGLKFGNMKDRIQLDIGVGDIVAPKKESLELYQYKGKPIFEGTVSLQVYPIETIFAEKIDSVVSRADTNSRMKDYHDLVLLCREKSVFNFSKLKKEINRTLKDRKTEKTFPINFSEDAIAKLQSLWIGHRNRLQVNADNLGLPTHIEEAINEINKWLFKNKIVS